MNLPESRLRGALAAILCAGALLAAPPARALPADTTSTLPIDLRLEPLAPCANDTVTLVAVNPCDPCFHIVSFGRASDGHLRLEFTQMLPAACATLPCSPQQARVRLGLLAAGHHTFDVEVVWHLPPDSVNTTGGTRILHRLVAFDVGACTSNKLPFVERVVVGGPSPCLSCPPEACPGKPVVLGLQGALPNSCWSLLGFEVLPLMSPGARPVARLTVREPNPASEMACTSLPVPFSVGTSLPPQFPGPHDVEIQVAVRSWQDSTGLRIASAVFPYVVKDSCPPPPPLARCVWPYLEPARPLRLDTLAYAPRCDLHLAPGGRGPVTFAVRVQDVPLAGLQGEIGASPFLKVINVEAVGPAAGMTVQWTPKGNGASYVLFSGAGAPIPPEVWAPVLRVTVRADSLPGAANGILHASVTAASDSNGTAVPVCPIMTLALPVANVCVGEAASCDANGDGLSNVADLVRMVRCLVNPGACPDTVAARPDCNGDGEFHLDDVFCCARAILGRPRDGGGVAPGGLHFSFGSPVMDGSVLRVPLHVQGAGDMGGALLRLDYPSDRWIAIDEGPGGGAPLRVQDASDWTPLVEYGSDDVLVGLLRLDPTAPSEMTVTLAFALRPGAMPGGRLTVGSSDLSAPDGTPIALDLGGLSATLDAGTPAVGGGIALSRAIPNPSTGATRFVVSLPAAGQVDLAVYDLAGRRVATLWQGALAAGSREFTWEPARVRSGVYFARLVVNGEVRTSRVTLRLAR